MIVQGGESNDTLNIIDSGSALNKTGELKSSFLVGLFPLSGTDFSYSGFEIINLDLSSGVNTFTVASTARDSETTVTAGPENDSLTVTTTQGDFYLYAGNGDDAIAVYGLGEDTLGVVYGQNGNDTLTVDGRTSAEGNLFDKTRLRWSGGMNDDKLLVNFTSFGTSNLDIFGDKNGTNTLTIDCPDLSCSILSRENFIANIQDMEDDETSVERINIDKTSTSGVSIIRVQLRLNDGENQVFFDDTFAPMQGTCRHRCSSILLHTFMYNLSQPLLFFRYRRPVFGGPLKDGMFSRRWLLFCVCDLFGGSRLEDFIARVVCEATVRVHVRYYVRTVFLTFSSSRQNSESGSCTTQNGTQTRTSKSLIPFSLPSPRAASCPMEIPFR